MGTNISDLIREAFIDPIRSVLIIDDRYPTWEHIFGDEGYNAGDEKWEQKSDILKLIRQFRKVSPALVVDIHDGSNNKDLGDYLHQSDLLILDYEIKPEPKIGDRAKEIVADLLKNDYFNQIVVHTATKDLTVPFYSFLRSLLAPLGITKEKAEKGKALVEEFEDLGLDAGTHPLQAIGLAEYFSYRRSLIGKQEPSTFISSAPELAKFRDLARSAGWSADQREQVFEFAIEVHDESLPQKAANLKVRWSALRPGERPWIRTHGAFIAFANKEDTDLLGVLGEAIGNWKPTPSRLISSKIRAEMSAQGAVAEDSALSDRRAYWQYYQELRKVEGDEETQNHRRVLLEEHLTRHTERLFDLISEETTKYGLKVLEADKFHQDTSNLDFSSHYGLGPEDEGKALDHYNAYISTKPVSGWHLQPGHIFEIGEELWVCVSPSCDLVPSQKDQLAIKNSEQSKIKPFLAVELSRRILKTSSNKQLKSTRKAINSNTLVYLSRRSGFDVTVETHSVAGENGDSAPVWRLFLAPDDGRFTINEDNTASLNLSYLRGKMKRYKGVKIQETEAKIVGQLRYEYALNLTQKLGVEFTRIGLGFSTP